MLPVHVLEFQIHRKEHLMGQGDFTKIGFPPPINPILRCMMRTPERPLGDDGSNQANYP